MNKLGRLKNHDIPYIIPNIKQKEISLSALKLIISITTKYIKYIISPSPIMKIIYYCLAFRKLNNIYLIRNHLQYCHIGISLQAKFYLDKIKLKLKLIGRVGCI